MSNKRQPFIQRQDTSKPAEGQQQQSPDGQKATEQKAPEGQKSAEGQQGQQPSGEGAPSGGGEQRASGDDGGKSASVAEATPLHPEIAEDLMQAGKEQAREEARNELRSELLEVLRAEMTSEVASLRAELAEADGRQKKSRRVVPELLVSSPEQPLRMLRLMREAMNIHIVLNGHTRTPEVLAWEADVAGFEEELNREPEKIE